MVKKLGKKTKGIVILCISIVLIFALTGGGIYLANLYGVGALNQHDHTAYAQDRDLLSFREPFTADCIWIDKNGVAVWAAFSKDITLNEDKDIAILDIACDTYYWLWVNGEEIVWEGSLKRGVTPDDGFYDHIVIQNKFKAGVNNVSILVRHLGDDGFSHKDSGQGGLIVEGTIGDVPFVTDGTWKAKQFAYKYSSINFLNNLNFRLSEKGSVIDAEKYSEFWLGQEPNDWDNAVVLDKEQRDKVFGKSYLNPLPSKKVGEVKYFDVSNYSKKFNKCTTISFDLGVNKQFCPYFEFESDKQGRKVKYYTENSRLNYKNTYISKQGENHFLDFAWINGEKLTITFDKGITIKKIGYRETGYNTEPVQNFICEDNDLNILWQKAVNTLMVTMRDSYMDCPDRERAEWIGDATIESEMSFYCLTPDSSKLFRKAIITTYGWMHKDGVIQTVVPDGVNAYELPVQNLAFLVGCVDYVKYSGDETVIPMILSMAQRYLPLWDIENDLVCHRKGSWDWGDWGNKIDMPALENAWYYYALSRLVTIADVDSNFYVFCQNRMETIARGYVKYYKSFGISSKNKADDRANAIAVLAGLYRQEDISAITETLYNVRNSSPYMEKYVEQALCELGRCDLAIARAKEVYAEMINDSCSTLWEFWDKKSGTTNHAWSGGSLVVLSRYLSGINPTEIGFNSFEVKPVINVVNEYSVMINPVEGVEISVKLENITENRKKLTVNCSSNGGVLKVSGKNFVFNGQHSISEQIEEKDFVLSIGLNELIFDN